MCFKVKAESSALLHQHRRKGRFNGPKRFVRRVLTSTCHNTFICNRSVRYLLGYNFVLSVEGQQTFRREMLSLSSGLNSKETKTSARRKQQTERPALSVCFILISCSGYSSNPEARGDLFLRNVGCLQTIHGVICQKIEFFITFAAKTSNPTILCLQTQEKCLIVQK